MDPMLWMILGGVFVVQLPFIADVLSGLFPGLGIARMTQRAVTVVLTFCVAMLFVLAMKQFCEMVAPRTESPASHYTVVVWLWLNTVSNYMGAVFVKSSASGPLASSLSNSSERTKKMKKDKKTPLELTRGESKTCEAENATSRSRASLTGGNATSSDLPDSSAEQSDGVNKSLDKSTSSDLSLDELCEAVSECSKCQCLRYPGTHHCRVCDRCIPMMDHHCPFTRNCVSKHNYTHFFLFLLYCAVGLVYATAMCYRDFNTCWMHDDFEVAEERLRLAGIDMHWTCRQLGSKSLVFLPVLVLALMMSSFLAFHCILLLGMDMSTIGFFGNWNGLSWRGLRRTVRAGEWERRFFRPHRRAHLFTWPAWQYVVPFCGQFGSLLLSSFTKRHTKPNAANTPAVSSPDYG